MANQIEISIIVEGYNYAEVGGLARFRQSLAAAVRMQQDQPGSELLLVDTAGLPELVQLLQEFPTVTRVDAIGMQYDQAKIHAAGEARGEYLLFFDGDCLPGPGWLEAHLAALKDEKIPATGGFTVYDGGFFAAVCTILDFGFLLPVRRRALACYASNNSGFRRSLLLACPPPARGLRCNCYAHTQILRRSGTPVLMIPEARVLHAMQPFFKERFRQGFDAVGSCWGNPALPQARLLRLGIAAAPLFYGNNVFQDCKRLWSGYRDLDIPAWAVPIAMLMFPALRLVDFAGMLRALAASRPAETAPAGSGAV